jgi:AcrR family transcriptional regulator
MVESVNQTESPAWKTLSGQSLHDRILEAASELMADEGVDSLRLERVARRAGCSRSSLYRYFDTKDALIIAVLRQRVDQMATRIRIQLAGTKRPADKIVEGVVRAVELALSDPQFSVLFSAPNSPTVMRIAASALPQLITPVVDSILPEPGEESWFPAGVPVADAARWLVTVVVGLVTFDAERAMDRDALTEHLERFLVPSLLGADAR